MIAVRSVTSPGRASQSTEEIEIAGRRLAVYSPLTVNSPQIAHKMLSNGELTVLPDTQEYREWIAEHSFSINGDVGLPGHFAQFLMMKAVSH